MSARTVVTTSVVALPDPELRARLQSTAALRYVCWPLLTFPDVLPATLAVGETARIRLAVAGLVPLWTHEITVREADDGGLLTAERGGPLRSWRHRLTVEPVDAGHTFYRDEVTLDAGRLTPFAVPAVRGLYRWRHRRWARLARARR